MTKLRPASAIVIVLAIAIGMALAWRHQETNTLQREIAIEREAQLRVQATARLNAAELIPAPVAVPDADREAVARLAAEVQQLKLRAAARASSAPTPRVVLPLPPSILDEMLNVDHWRNAGQATAAATLETALWAAAGGDVDTLAGLLSIDPVVRSEVNVLLLGLSEPLRAEYGTPERLIALLSAKDVPLGAAQIHDFKPSQSSDTRLIVRMRDLENNIQSAILTLHQEGEAWKLVVPASAVERYAKRLKGTTTSR